MTTPTALWLGYEFVVYESVFPDWREVGGLYVFVGSRLDEQGMPRWHPLYVGQTQDFSTRLPTHEK